MNLSRRFTLLALLLSLSATIHASQEQVHSPYMFGVFPYFSPLRLDDIYAPVSQELSGILGRQVKFTTSTTFEIFLAKLKSRHYDFAIIPPILYPVAIDELQYLPVVRMEEKLQSLILVREDSTLMDIEDLRGKVIATPPRKGPVIGVVKRAMKERNMKPDEHVDFRAFKSVSSGLQQLLAGKVDACIAPSFAYASFAKSRGVKLRTLWQSSSLPNLSLVIHPRVPQQDRDGIQEALLSWRDSIKGQALLRGMSTQGFVPVDDKEYDVIRSFIDKSKK